MNTLVRRIVFPHLNFHVVLNSVEIKSIHLFGTLIKLARVSRTLDRSIVFVVTSFLETSLALGKSKFLKYFKLTSNLYTSVILMPLLYNAETSKNKFSGGHIVQSCSLKIFFLCEIKKPCLSKC